MCVCVFVRAFTDYSIIDGVYLSRQAEVVAAQLSSIKAKGKARVAAVKEVLENLEKKVCLHAPKKFLFVRQRTH